MTILHYAVVIDDIETAQYHLRTKVFTYYHWSILSCEYTLTESFIEKYFDKLNLTRIQIYQKLSESFIDKFEDKLDWNLLVQYQTFSKNIIEKFEDKINLQKNIIKWNTRYCTLKSPC